MRDSCRNAALTDRPYMLARRQRIEGMTRVFTAAATALAIAAAPAAAQANIEGHWTNPKHSTLVHVTRCDGNAYCAIVLKASAKAQANARKGGTKNFIGTEILHVSEAGDNLYRGKAFDRECNLHVLAMVRFGDAATVGVHGCEVVGTGGPV